MTGAEAGASGSTDAATEPSSSQPSQAAAEAVEVTAASKAATSGANTSGHAAGSADLPAGVSSTPASSTIMAQNDATPLAVDAVKGADDDEDFGDFDTASLPAVASTSCAATQAASPAVAPSPMPAALASSAAGGDTSTPAGAATADWDDDDEFGDFDAAPSAAPATINSITGSGTAPAAAVAVAAPAPVPALSTSSAPTTLAADGGDDEFGDFGDAGSSSAPVAVQAPPAAPVPAAVSAPVPAAPAAVDGPDILQLSGDDFLAAVLDAWQVLDAPAIHRAVAARQPPVQPEQQVPAVQLPLPHWPSLEQQQQQQGNSIFSQCGLPLLVDGQPSYPWSRCSSHRQQQQQHPQIPQGDEPSTGLEWHGSSSEARLVARMGMTQTVQRALAALGKEAPAADTASG